MLYEVRVRQEATYTVYVNADNRDEVMDKMYAEGEVELNEENLHDREYFEVLDITKIEED